MQIILIIGLNEQVLEQDDVTTTTSLNISDKTSAIGVEVKFLMRITSDVDFQFEFRG